MASFDYQTYAAAVAAAQAKNSGVKVGFFKLADKGTALVRFNIKSLADLKYETLHRVKRSPTDGFPGMNVSCTAAFGTHDRCPLCEAAALKDDRVTPASKRVFIELLISYKDAMTGTWTAPLPVVWERPAAFTEEIVSKINNYGDLSQHLFTITRSGARLDTRYTIDYAVPAVYKAERIPADFSVFENFDISKQSYWVKSIADCDTYIQTGSFPEAPKAEPVVNTSTNIMAPADTVKPVTLTEETVKPVVQPAAQPVVEQTPAPATAPSPTQPTPGTFGGFSF